MKLSVQQERLMTRVGGVALLTVAFVSNAFGGSEQIIKQRAKDLRDQNNARQGFPPPSARPATPSSTTPTTPSPTTPTTITMTPQQQAMARLQASLAAIRPGVRVTSEMKQQLASDMTA